MKMPDSFLALTFTFKSLVLKAIREEGMEVAPMEIKSLHLINRLESCTAAVMSEQMDRDKGQIARLIKEMINKGLIEKTPNPNDTRSQLIQLTEQGRSLLDRMLAIESKMMERMLVGLSQKQVDTFNQVAVTMTENLKQ